MRTTIAMLLMLLALAGCGETRQLERIQDSKKIDADSIEARLGRLEADVELLKMRGK